MKVGQFLAETTVQISLSPTAEPKGSPTTPSGSDIQKTVSDYAGVVQQKFGEYNETAK